MTWKKWNKCSKLKQSKVVVLSKRVEILVNIHCVKWGVHVKHFMVMSEKKQNTKINSKPKVGTKRGWTH